MSGRGPANVGARTGWIVSLGVAVFGALLVACQRESPPRSAKPVALPPGVVVDYGSTGGITGWDGNTVVYDDGRVERDNGFEAKTPSGRLPVARVNKLVDDLAASGVFAEGDCCVAVHPGPDSTYEQLVVRDRAGAVHWYSTAGGSTSTVETGMRLVKELLTEIQPYPAADAGNPRDAAASGD